MSAMAMLRQLTGSSDRVLLNYNHLQLGRQIQDRVLPAPSKTLAR